MRLDVLCGQHADIDFFPCFSILAQAMRKIAILSLCLFAFSCAHAPQQPDAPQPAGKQIEKEAAVSKNYPYSEIEVIYDTVLKTMMRKFLASIETDGRQYGDALKSYVDKTIPRSKFVSMMISPDGESDNTKRIFDRARTDIAFRDTKEFKDCFDVTVNVSVPMGMIIIGGRFDVFRAKYVQPTDVTNKLFPMADNEDYEEFISWTIGEVGVERVKNELGEKVEILPGDTFYYFRSPDWYWQQLAGRQGYLQVRGDKIINAHITMLN